MCAADGIGDEMAGVERFSRALAAPAPSGPAVRFRAASPHTILAVRAALERASYHLKREGNGPNDEGVARIIDSIIIEEDNKG